MPSFRHWLNATHAEQNVNLIVAHFGTKPKRAGPCYTGLSFVAQTKFSECCVSLEERTARHDEIVTCGCGSLKRGVAFRRSDGS